MRPRLTPAQLAKTQLEYENSSHVPEITFTSVLSRLKPTLLQQSATELLFQPGEIIVQEGEVGDAVFIIRSGVVAALKGDLKSPAVLGFCGPGEVVGEIALIDNRPRSASLAAIRVTRLVRVRRDTFQALILEDTSVGVSLLRTLAGRLREADADRAATILRSQNTSSEVLNLRAEKERLLELQHLREEMSNLVVHDLRVPLGNITNALGLLRMVLPTQVWSENQEVLEIARSSAERLTRLSESLLEMSRLESGEITIRWSTFGIDDLICVACEQMDLHLRGSMAIRKQIAMRIPPIRGDQDLLMRVLLNLLDNAIKYSPLDGVITISAEPHRTRLLVAVSDTGPGIPVNQRERVFERFARVEDGKKTYTGFGLGLVFCRLAVEAHGGKIWVEDGDNGVGSKVAFNLPILGK
jgi:signal transduction histidine kinase